MLIKTETFINVFLYLFIYSLGPDGFEWHISAMKVGGKKPVIEFARRILF